MSKMGRHSGIFKQGFGNEDPFMTAQPLTDNDYRALALFRRTLRHFLHFSSEAAVAAGLEPQQYQALLALRGAPGAGAMTVGGLAEELMIRPHSAVGLVTRLERQGLVAREKRENDRRQVFVVLTPRGDEILSGLAAAHKDELRKAVPTLRTLVERLDGVSG
jgi:DNA-binding MarR family transcriptional regulator